MSKEEFWQAIDGRNEARVKEILQANPQYASEWGERRACLFPLTQAMEYNEIEMMKEIIAAAVRVDKDYVPNPFSLIGAYSDQNVDALKLLLVSGAFFPASYEYIGCTLIRVAIGTGSQHITAITLVSIYHKHAQLLLSGDPELAGALENALEVAMPYAVACLAVRAQGSTNTQPIEKDYARIVCVGSDTKVALRAPISQFVYDDTTEEESADVIDVVDATEVVVLASQVLPAAEAGEAAEAAEAGAPRTAIDYAATGALLGHLTLDWDTLGLEM